jgi:hypothetical protein
MNWDQAIIEAKLQLGYHPSQYINNWNLVVETAREILLYESDKEYEEFCDQAEENYREYLNGDRWKKLRIEILKRDDFKCVDGGEKATQVHHLNYTYLNTSQEANHCVSLCRRHHRIRHGIETPLQRTPPLSLRMQVDYTSSFCRWCNRSFWVIYTVGWPYEVFCSTKCKENFDVWKLTTPELPSQQEINYWSRIAKGRWHRDGDSNAQEARTTVLSNFEQD